MASGDMTHHHGTRLACVNTRDVVEFDVHEPEGRVDACVDVGVDGMACGAMERGERAVRRLSVTFQVFGATPRAGVTPPVLRGEKHSDGGGQLLVADGQSWSRVERAASAGDHGVPWWSWW